MPKTQPKSGDLLALAMRHARDDVAAGRVPKHSPDSDARSSDRESPEAVSETQ